MKKLVSRFLVLSFVVVSCFFGVGQSGAEALEFRPLSWSGATVMAAEGDRRNRADELLRTDFGKKLDLNNSDVRDFRELRGFYPNLSSKIVKNAPYGQVEDVLNIPDLSDAQKARLEENLDRFTVNEPVDIFNEGDDRFNPGVYD